MNTNQLVSFFHKKTLFLSVLSIFLMFSCENEEKTPDSYQEVELIEDFEEEDYIDESEYADYDFEDNVLTLEAMLDGPDEWFYAYLPDDSEIDLENFEYDIISIIPANYSQDNSLTQIYSLMVALAEDNFKMYEPYNKGTKIVDVYYNRAKTVKMISYEVVKGNPNGICTVYLPDGNKFIERNYDEGELIKSIIEPFAVDWKFDQEKSYLDIFDMERALTVENARDVINIMRSNNKGVDNSLYKIIEKESFKNPFVINDIEFTGILKAYFHPKAFDKNRLYYELNFTNGWLDGDIKIYDDWGGLELHEIFVMGKLDSTVFQQEYADGVAKPILYFYPAKDMFIDVKLDFDGRLTHTYPKYNNGWQIYAKTDGTIYDASKQEYYALYWEGQANNEFIINEGFVVEGKNTISFLENSLSTLGLNRKEANEFIIYWLPQMENNTYNLIHFSTNEYEEMAKLTIIPKPETLIRVMMVFQPLNEKNDIPTQDLSKLKVTRKGFTVVEWGGKKLEHKQNI